jgi:hypothetical protein
VTQRDKTLDELVARVDEARPIDWAHEIDQAANDEDRRLVQGLKALSEVAAYLRDPDKADDPVPDAQPGTPWADLTVFEAVGRGAFGTVHRAIDSVNRTVALKLLDPGRDLVALKARIFDEARLMARFRHDNVVLVYGAGESDGRVGLWMEFIDGVTLAAEVAAQGPMSADEAVTIGRKLCSALAAIHAEGYAHADVKAQNVMRQRGGRIVLMDLGASQSVVEADPTRLSGTPLYLSPERLAGAAASPSTDIYALGVLLYFLVTGAYPVDGDTREEVERAHRAGQRTRLKDRRPELSDAFIAAIESAIAPEPKDRHATAGAFDAALQRVAPAPPTRRRNRWFLPVIGVASAAASIFLAVWMVGAADPSPTPGVRVPELEFKADGYDVQAAFFQVSEQGRAEKPWGARIAPGDALELDLRLSKPANVFVVNEDDQGSATLLFPLEDGTLSNPLPAGTTHTLPGPSRIQPVQWKIDSFGGREHFYVIVAPVVDSQLQAAIDRLVPASDDPPQLAGGLRGASSLAHHKVPVTIEPPWRKQARPLSAPTENTSGAWMRVLTLENPKPPGTK